MPLNKGSVNCISVEDHVKDGCICSPLNDVTFDIDGHEHLIGLYLADPVPRDSSQSVILLGAQYYFDVMLGMVARLKSSNLAP